jgi:hypothetical protein
MLQREYHCYNSARLEAAVEALERGLGIEEVPIRKLHLGVLRRRHADCFEASRLCLDLLNEELEQRLEANEETKLHH